MVETVQHADNGELWFIHKYLGEHEAQVTGTIDLVQISNAPGQQFTSNNGTTLSDSATQTVRKSLITTVTTLSIALSSPALTADETPNDSPEALALRLYTLARLVVTSHGNI
ncbi:hypothetical protein AVEN_261637-1 [Araneus ventricosus]|uniref:Uncharacterized protein n=1 Tax=Araneus ventricosus TaxID=182803 RepID=A0A4Y2JLK7_ARAVE|nr:hypothetical protein AVEN_261637-1 [Araneus ventricosus]